MWKSGSHFRANFWLLHSYFHRTCPQLADCQTWRVPRTISGVTVMWVQLLFLREGWETESNRSLWHAYQTCHNLFFYWLVVWKPTKTAKLRNEIRLSIDYFSLFFPRRRSFRIDSKINERNWEKISHHFLRRQIFMYLRQRVITAEIQSFQSRWDWTSIMTVAPPFRMSTLAKLRTPVWAARLGTLGLAPASGVWERAVYHQRGSRM